jgi:hypothetical protein
MRLNGEGKTSRPQHGKSANPSSSLTPTPTPTPAPQINDPFGANVQFSCTCLPSRGVTKSAQGNLGRLVGIHLW